MRALQGAIAERRGDVVAAARALLEERRKFLVLIEAEFHRDWGRLTLPAMFHKWPAIFEGIALAGAADRRLDALSVPSHDPGVLAKRFDPQIASLPLFGNILSGGQYFDLDQMAVVDWKAGWQSDQALAALNRHLAGIAAAAARAEKVIAGDKVQRQKAAEAERQAEQAKRQADYHPAPVNQYMHVPPQTESERNAPPQEFRPYVAPDHRIRTGGAPSRAIPSDFG